MLTDKQYKEIRKELDSCKKPLFFFHDDPDGLASFILLYNYVKEGKGVIVKTTPVIDEKFIRKVEEYGPDKIFIVDIAVVKQEFIDEVKLPIVWIDHHEPLKLKNIKYFNPKNNAEEGQPASYLCYRTVQQDMWIAMLGCIGDWFLPDFADEFREKYEDLLPKTIKRPEDALFNSRMGELVKIISMIMKGKTSDVLKCVKIITRIKDPYEILDQTTPQGKYIFKRHLRTREHYDELLNKAKKTKAKDGFLMFIYPSDKFAFSKELSNELLYLFPESIIIVGREKNGEMKISLRAKKNNILKMLKKALEGVEGYGGGHNQACGACVKVEDFEKFIEQFKAAL